MFASAKSANRIAGVVATVGNRDLPLTRILLGATGAIEAWVGKMLLTGMEYGSVNVVLKATDSQNVFGLDSVSFSRVKLVLGGKGYPASKKLLVPVAPPIPRP